MSRTVPRGGDAKKDDAREEQRRERIRLLDLTAVGLAFPLALLIGYFGGRVVGSWLGSESVGAMIGTGLGIGGGFYNLYKMVARMSPSRSSGGGGDGHR